MLLLLLLLLLLMISNQPYRNISNLHDLSSKYQFSLTRNQIPKLLHDLKEFFSRSIYWPVATKLLVVHFKDLHP